MQVTFAGSMPPHSECCLLKIVGPQCPPSLLTQKGYFSSAQWTAGRFLSVEAAWSTLVMRGPDSGGLKFEA
eukprot:1157675-Pelagomonas_calceolata.AAC.5